MARSSSSPRTRAAATTSSSVRNSTRSSSCPRARPTRSVRSRPPSTAASQSRSRSGFSAARLETAEAGRYRATSSRTSAEAGGALMSNEEREGVEERIEQEAARYGMTRSQFLKWGGVLAAAATVAPRSPAAFGATHAQLTTEDLAVKGGTLKWLSWPGHNDKEFLGPFEKK